VYSTWATIFQTTARLRQATREHQDLPRGRRGKGLWGTAYSSALPPGQRCWRLTAAIRFAVAREFSLSAEQTRRLVYSHAIGQLPPGYGERLQRLCVHAPGETGVELLTNKLLVQRGLDPLVRTFEGGYDLAR